MISCIDIRFGAVTMQCGIPIKKREMQTAIAETQIEPGQRSSGASRNAHKVYIMQHLAENEWEFTDLKQI